MDGSALGVTQTSRMVGPRSHTFNGVREKSLCRTMIHNTEEMGSGGMQIDGGPSGEFSNKQQKQKPNRPSEDGKRLGGLRGSGRGLTAGVGGYGQGDVEL